MVKMKLLEEPVIKMVVTPSEAEHLRVAGEIVQTAFNPYTGDYEVVPGPEEQVLSTKDKSMYRDVVIAPIPKNYGLITYDQNRTITIS